MKCPRCETEIGDSPFCPGCGAKAPKKEPKQTSFYNSKQMKIIGLMIGVVVLLIVVFVFLGNNKFNNTKRTIMIYMVGSDLESNSALATAELGSLKSQDIDLKNINVLVYTGGTKLWRNTIISNTSNQIFILEKNDTFRLVKEYDQLNMGDPSTLSEFLNYAYNNYKADIYDLILYDHGGAIDGAIYDDFTNDNLSLADMAEAMKNSPFTGENKLETVYFSTCLNGSIELANVFKDYAKYLIASEEVSMSASYTDTLGFINNITSSSDGSSYGKIALERYEEQMKMINFTGENIYTYSVIDLSKIDTINEKLTEYINGLDLNSNYKNITQARSQLYEYGNEDNSHDYEMVDLYDFIEKTKAFSKENGEALQKEIKAAIKHNITNQKTSNGLSVYLPLYGHPKVKEYFMNIYKDLDYSTGYISFLNNFYSLQKSPTGYSFNVTKNKVVTGKEQDITLELTPEQLNTYLDGEFYILAQDKEHPNYYSLVLYSNDVTLDNNILKANYNNKVIEVTDHNGDREIIPTYHLKGDTYVRYTKALLPVLKDTPTTSSEQDKYYHNVSLNFIEKDKKVVLSSARMNSVNDHVNGTMVNLKDYEEFMIPRNYYKVLDDNGNFMERDKWESDPYARFIAGKIKDMNPNNINLSLTNDYYVVFAIKDIYGNTSYSTLRRVGA